jgi:O-antigen/teichoic acid export membrane protein
LLVSILLSLYFSVSVSCYSAPLLLHRRLFDFYLGQTAAAAVRLGAYITLSATALLGPGTASLISGGSVLINGAIALRKSSLLMEMPKRADKATNKEVLKYVLPAAPACLFAAFQPQLSLFLVGVFGQTLQIAEVAALTKISQIFLIINTFNAVVIEPYVAKIRADQLASTYVRLIGSAIAFTALLSIVSLLFPSAITAITGSKYQQLSRVVPLTVLSSCVNAVANLIWIMNRSRRWQFWRGSALEIGLLVCCQTIFIVTLGVRTTRDAAMFSLATSITILAVHTYIMIYGFQKSATRKNRQEFEANATRDPNPQ